MEEGLFKWLEIFGEPQSPSKLSDGIFFSRILNEISPQIFSESKFLSKIKQSESVGSNWRLKFSNLKKILDGIWEFYDELNATLPEELKPDLNKIAENNEPKEIGKLIQLILGIAVNCAEKQKYITQITELEESIQSNIMKAIQEIEYIWLSSRSSISTSISSTDLKLVQEERDIFAQKCHDR
jgi:protein HOOK3